MEIVKINKGKHVNTYAFYNGSNLMFETGAEEVKELQLKRSLLVRRGPKYFVSKTIRKGDRLGFKFNIDSTIDPEVEGCYMINGKKYINLSAVSFDGEKVKMVV